MNWAYADNALIRIPIRCPANGYYMRWYYNGWHYWFFLPGLHVIDTEGERYRTLSKRLITVSSGQVTRGQAAGIRTIMNTREVYLWTDGGWAAIRIEPGSLKIYQSAVAGTEMELTAIIGSREVTRTTGFSPVPPITNVDPTYPWCEMPIIIADQVWMCANYDIAYPGSKVYNNLESNRAGFGGLYTYEQVMAPGFIPAGWHVPTVAEWTTLINAVGGAATAGGVLKEVGTTRWNAPNTDAVDTYNFAAVAGGYSTPSTFSMLMTQGMFWTADPYNVAPLPSNMFARSIRMNHDSGAVVTEYIPRSYFLSVRLIRDTPVTLFPVIYGFLYNYYAATDVRNITAAGWHVPTLTEIGIFVTFISSAGGKLKEVGTTYWNNPNTGATNELNFNSKGSGLRDGTDGVFGWIRERGWILASNLNAGRMQGYICSYDSTFIQYSVFSDAIQTNGVPIRPIKDSTILNDGQSGTYIGNDGRVYRTIAIGAPGSVQEYLADNLCETLYRDGSPIPEVTGNAAWAALSTGARCSYDNDESNAHA